jgi:hypothetical protein
MTIFRGGLSILSPDRASRLRCRPCPYLDGFGRAMARGSKDRVAKSPASLATIGDSYERRRSIGRDTPVLRVAHYRESEG